MFCWFQIGDGNIHRTPGMDPLDALSGAIKTIDVLLSHIRNDTDQGLHWKNALKEGDLGLPSFYPPHTPDDEKRP